MTKATMKSLLMTAAMSGLLTGASTTLSASTTNSNSGASSITRAMGLSASSSYDDKKTEKQNKSINEPVQFLTAKGGHIPYELVINQVNKNEIVGYLSTPKEQAAR